MLCLTSVFVKGNFGKVRVRALEKEFEKAKDSLSYLYDRDSEAYKAQVLVYDVLLRVCDEYLNLKDVV